MFLGKEHLDKEAVSYQQEGLVQFVIDSVYSLAHAVESMIREKCNGSTVLCPAGRNLAGSELLRHIRNVSFQGKKNNIFFNAQFYYSKFYREIDG